MWGEDKTFVQGAGRLRLDVGTVSGAVVESGCDPGQTYACIAETGPGTDPPLAPAALVVRRTLQRMGPS